jgi:CBS domain-containing protein
MNIQDIMSKPALTCRDTDSLQAAAQLMWEHDCGAIPVTDHAGKLVGMVTDRDICMATYTQGKPPQDLLVADAMAKQVFSGHVHDSVDAIESLMSEKQIRRIPILNGDNRPVGVVSLNDLARHAAVANKKSGLEHALTQTLAAICRPRRSRASEALVKRVPQATL